MVANAKTIIVTKNNEDKNYFARVKFISYQADLALLEPLDKHFFKDTKSLKLSQNIKISDKIKALGYPLSSYSLVTKNGKVLNIKQYPYIYSNEELMALELNVDIKSGNSGGAILNKNNDLVGISMQMPKNNLHKAYAVPTYIINTFLEDIKDNKIDGYHSNENTYQYISNPIQKEFLNTKQSGILVTSIDVQEKQLKEEDIILEVEEQKLSNLNEEKFKELFHSKVAGQTILMKIMRNKKIIKLKYTLNNSKKLINQEYNKKARYIVLDGLIFTPITRNYLQSIGLKQYEMNMLFYGQKKTKQYFEPVAWMQTKFSNKKNKGYDSKVEILKCVNEKEVRSFEHFKELIKNTKEKYLILEFLNHDKVVLKTKNIISNPK